MSLSVDDWYKLDAKFEGVHTRISEQTRQIVDLDKKLEAARQASEFRAKTIKIEPCKDVAAHEKKHHNWFRFWSMVAAIMTSAGALAGIIAWIVTRKP